MPDKVSVRHSFFIIMPSPRHFLSLLICAASMACLPGESNYLTVVQTGTNCIASVPASELFKIKKVVKLQTTDSILLGPATQLLVTDSLIVFLNREVSRSVTGFDKNGKLLFHLNGGGKGPMEFAEPEFVQLNPKNNCLYIYDYSLAKILVFSIDEKRYIREFTHVPSLIYFEFLPYGFLYVTDDYATENGKYNYIRIISQPGHWSEAKTVLETECEIIIEAAYEQSFFYSGNTLYYLQAFVNRLYKIDGQQMTPVLDIELPQIPEREIYCLDYQTSYSKIMENNYFFLPHRGNLSDKHLSFLYLNGKDYHLARISFADMKSNCYQSIENDWFGGDFPLPNYTNNGIFHSIVAIDEIPENKMRSFLRQYSHQYNSKDYLLLSYSFK